MKKVLMAGLSAAKKLGLLLGILLVLVILWCVIWYYIDKPYYPERHQAEQALTVLLQRIQLGDPPDLVLGVYHENASQHLQLFRHDHLWRVNMAPRGIFSESDWVLNISFKEERVTAVYIRSSDGPYKPAGSPPDKGETPAYRP